MNLYIRYFQNETVVKSVEEACEFLSSISDITVDRILEDDLRRFMADTVSYPKRYKVKGKSYFIAIKTPLETLEEFHLHGDAKREEQEMRQAARREKMDMLAKPCVGWYDASMTFKRVITLPSTQKSTYCDTQFKVRLKAASIQDCYDRIIDHLRARRDIDPRSQFPSITRNFECRFLGAEV